MVSQEIIDKIYKEFGPYGYIPTEIGAAVFVAVFALLFFAHTFQALKSKQYFMLIVAFEALLECTANSIRIYGHFHPQVTDPYIAQQVLLVVTPVFFAAVQFTILGRVLSIFGDQYSLVKPRFIVPVFVSIDVISLIIQGAGSGIAAVAEIDGKDVTDGGNIVVGGLCLQLFAYMIGSIIAVNFALRTHKSPPQHQAWSRHTRIGLLFAFASALLILTRSIYRTIEMAEGWIGVIATTEWTLLAFDSSLVAIAVLLLNIYHPSRYLSGSSSDRGGFDEENLKTHEMTANQPQLQVPEKASEESLGRKTPLSISDED